MRSAKFKLTLPFFALKPLLSEKKSSFTFKSLKLKLLKISSARFLKNAFLSLFKSSKSPLLKSAIFERLMSLLISFKFTSMFASKLLKSELLSAKLCTFLASSLEFTSTKKFDAISSCTSFSTFASLASLKFISEKMSVWTFFRLASEYPSEAKKTKIKAKIVAIFFILY